MGMDTIVRDERLYQELIMDRARAPRHGTLLECFDAESEGNNPMCGDRLTLRLRLDNGGRIEAAGFLARGCAISVASADLMADAVRGLDTGEARALGERFGAMVATGEVPGDARFAELGALAGVHEFRSRVRCATLAWSALDRALSEVVDERA